MDTQRAKIGVQRLVLGTLLVALFAWSGVGAVYGQELGQKEVCNGKDDTGEGKVDEGVNCDHYLSYLLDKPIQPTKVTLSDQFIQPTDFQLTLIERLLNPSRKMHAGLAFNPRRPDLHYLAYRLQTNEPFQPRQVVVDNQFEKRVVVATNPRYLLTPTGKNKLGINIERILNRFPENATNTLVAAVAPKVPQNANHYLCYDVEPYDVAAGVSLKDQFQGRQYEVIKAKYLCNPVEKRHNEKVSEIVDRENHLMCYEVKPHNQVKRKVLTRDQFGLKSQTTIQTEELCVPSLKTHVESEVELGE